MNRLTKVCLAATLTGLVVCVIIFFVMMFLYLEYEHDETFIQFDNFNAYQAYLSILEKNNIKYIVVGPRNLLINKKIYGNRLIEAEKQLDEYTLNEYKWCEENNIGQQDEVIMKRCGSISRYERLNTL